MRAEADDLGTAWRAPDALGVDSAPAGAAGVGNGAGTAALSGREGGGGGAVRSREADKVEAASCQSHSPPVLLRSSSDCIHCCWSTSLLENPLP
jgi:hypothetical protein